MPLISPTEFPATVHTANGCPEDEGEGDREVDREGVGDIGDADGLLVTENETLGDFDTDGEDA